MFTESLTKTSDGKNIAWKATPGANDLTLANGLGAIVWTAAIPLIDCDQVNLLLSPTWGDLVDMRLRVQWSADVAVLRWCNDSFTTSAVAAGVNTVSANVNEWKIDPNVSTNALQLLFPVGAHYARLGVYSNGAPNAANVLLVDVERMRTNPTQQ
jgi:hypothetical protein